MNQERILSVLLSPHQTEKTVRIADKNNQFTFKVVNDAGKLEVKKAVEQLFNVKVKNISIVNVKAKTKRFKQILGKRKGWKKAYVTLQEGFDISFNESAN